MNHHDLLDNHQEPVPCPADAKPGVNGSSNTAASQRSEPEPSSSVLELLLKAVLGLTLEHKATNVLLSELCQQNAMLIGMIAVDTEDQDEHSDSQYLDGSRVS